MHTAAVFVLQQICLAVCMHACCADLTVWFAGWLCRAVSTAHAPLHPCFALLRGVCFNAMGAAAALAVHTLLPPCVDAWNACTREQGPPTDYAPAALHTMPLQAECACVL